LGGGRDIFAASQKYHRLRWLFALFWDVGTATMPEPIKKYNKNRQIGVYQGAFVKASLKVRHLAPRHVRR
jgi:hypothetical protein